MPLEDLDSFYGSERFYRHHLNRKLIYTEGVKYVADSGTYWLIDEVAIANDYEPKVKAEGFQLWVLTKKGTAGTLTCDDGNGNVVYTQDIPFTDFPLDSIKFYVVDNEQGGLTMMLPSEY